MMRAMPVAFSVHHVSAAINTSLSITLLVFVLFIDRRIQVLALLALAPRPELVMLEQVKNVRSVMVSLLLFNVLPILRLMSPD